MSASPEPAGDSPNADSATSVPPVAAGQTAGLPPGPLRPKAPMGRHLALFAVVLALIGLDLWSKSAVFAWLDTPGAANRFGVSGYGQPRYSIAGDWLGFMLNLNYGAAFGQGSGAQGILVGGRCIAAVFLAILIWRTPTGQRVYLTALVLILAGALGNLYDNLLFEPHAGLAGYVPERSFGPVRDFIDVYFARWDWHFPTFNVADSCISVGAVLLLLSGLLGPKGAQEPGHGDTAMEPSGSTDNLG